MLNLSSCFCSLALDLLSFPTFSTKISKMRPASKVSLLTTWFYTSFILNTVHANYGNFDCKGNTGSASERYHLSFPSFPLPFLILISVSQALTSAATCLTPTITPIASRLGMENSLVVSKVRTASSSHQREPFRQLTRRLLRRE